MHVASARSSTTGLQRPRRTDVVGAERSIAVLNRRIANVMCVGLLMSAPAISTAQTTREAERQVTVSGTVESVDYTGRTVTVRGQQGNPVTVDVPPNARRFEQIKVGDGVTATYYDRVTVRVKPAGEPAVDRTVDAIPRRHPGHCPVPREPDSG